MDLDLCHPRRATGNRLLELALLLLALLFVFGGLIALSLVERGELTTFHLRPGIVLAVLSLAGWGVLTWFPSLSRGQGLIGQAHDPILYPATVLLCGWGLIEVIRLQERFATRQLIWVSAGLVVLVLAATLPYRWSHLSRYRYLWLLSGLGGLVLTILWGVNPLGVGDRLWLSVGRIFYIQPSELLKVLLVFFLASYLSEKRELLLMTRRIGWLRLPPLAYLVPLLGMWGLSLILLIWQQDLGAALLFFSVFISMLYVATGRAMYVWAGLAMLVVVAAIGSTFIDRVQLRGSIWLDPWSDAQGSGYQLVQALLAFASGGLFGSGVGLGYPTPWIPVAHTDFVFAAIGEEWGMLGALGVLLIWVILTSRGLHAAMRAILPGAREPALRVESSFVCLLAVGLSALLGWQSAIIVGGTLKLIPLTGITLPFVSYGGSSMLVSCLMVGLLIRASAYRGRQA
jgi:cell division protein FtsW (lipid II flippase)